MTALPALEDAWPAREQALVRALAERVRRRGGRALIVGGAVRDALLGQPSGDLDIEVFGLPAADLPALLGEIGSFVNVGRSFPVWKARGAALDIALPRRERPTGRRHQDFAIEVDPAMPLEDAARRRDFTINSLFYDPLQRRPLDPCGGLADLAAGRLRHTSDQFGEDPLRVLRAMQFAARFDFAVAPATVGLCAQLHPAHLPAERLWPEWEKLLVRGQVPSRGLHFLTACGWLRYFPELLALRDCPQAPEWHPEGDAWIHTLHALDAFARERAGDPAEDRVVGLAVLCHDLGKAACTRWERGRWRSPEHESKGTDPTRRFLARLTRESALIEAVVALVRTHMRPHQLAQADAGDAAIRRLAREVGRLDRLVRVSQADAAGRPPLVADDHKSGDWLLARAESLALKDERPRPLLQGRDLLALGLPPGPEMGRWLDRFFEEQLDGVFADHTAAIRHAAARLQAADAIPAQSTRPRPD